MIIKESQTVNSIQWRRVKDVHSMVLNNLELRCSDKIKKSKVKDINRYNRDVDTMTIGGVNTVVTMTYTLIDKKKNDAKTQ